MEIVVPLIVAAVLILLNGVFVAAEFAIIGVPRASIDRRAADGERAAKAVQRVLHDPVRQDRYIATAQLGITFASLGLGMYGEHALAEWIVHRLDGLGLGETGLVISAHALASILAIAFLTYFHIVVGEMVPKSMALMRAEGTALKVSRPMLLLQKAMYPLVVGLNGLGNAILRLVGVRREMGAAHYHTPEELEFIVRESQEGGLLRAEAGRVLRELFDFGALEAGEAMVPRVRVAGIPAGAPPETLRQRIAAAPHTRYPVYEGDLDHVVGVVHIKDLLRVLREDRPLAPADVRPTAFLPATLDLDRVLQAMHEARTQLVVVMDEHGGMAGILSIEDLGVEAVGAVAEGGDEPAEIVQAGEAFSVDGTVRLGELGDRLGRTVEHGEVDTVSGLVLALLERPPVVGDVVSEDGLRFEVEAVAGHGVARCRVTVEPAPEADED